MGKTSRWPLVVWILVIGVTALLLLAVAIASGVVSAVLVDALPGGGWTPEDTTPEIDAVIATAEWSLVGFLVVVTVGVTVPLVAAHRRGRRARMQQIRADTPV